MFFFTILDRFGTKLGIMQIAIGMELPNVANRNWMAVLTSEKNKFRFDNVFGITSVGK